MPPPPTPAPASSSEEHEARSSFESRSSRSTSSASRNTNRLSLTLPIAPPTSLPSRPTPVSTGVPSCPPTPSDSGLMSPTDSNDFIIAIAAQERRVLELREELNRAELDLKQLKKQWTHHEAHKKRQDARKADPLRPLVVAQTNTPNAGGEGDATASRTVDIDRRRALLLGQQSNQSTPTSGRRRVIRGGHTRALSLLSPVKTGDAFSVLEDSPETGRLPMKDSEPHLQNLARHAPITAAQLSKRASWAPRSVHPAASQGVKQIAEDFKAGLWTFVEDLRQATVGDEPINGGGLPMRRIDSNARSPSARDYSGDQDTIRASASHARPHVANAFNDTPTPASKHVDAMAREEDGANHKRVISKAESKATKRFSWTPLSMDSLDDNDWSNWDTPTAKSPRWSGTTVNGDIIPAIPEGGDENTTPLKKKSSTEPAAPTSPSSLKLEELSLGVLNRLSPGNIKRTASDFMKEWEKSLSPPPEPITFAAKEKGT
ncbi:DUF4048 domain protein [Pleurostoma richardsiae]|uniref:DUF4048 domain protein n=1 Tax=Pleurostoma richardsiae TaxID=41990 RepID=A0AA38VNG5_9PEZI|nr:DUF4048 domain protein [Pleurostoma richardsiae]